MGEKSRLALTKDWFLPVPVKLTNLFSLHKNWSIKHSGRWLHITPDYTADYTVVKPLYILYNLNKLCIICYAGINLLTYCNYIQQTEYAFFPPKYQTAPHLFTFFNFPLRWTFALVEGTTKEHLWRMHRNRPFHLYTYRGKELTN